jgi:hypothetical protein
VAATDSVKVIKNFSYRQSAKDFSNRYHFVGGTPVDDTAWHTLFDAIVLQEKTIYTSEVEIISCVGYIAGSDMPVSSKAYSTAGTLSTPALGKLAAGEMCILGRYSTNERSTKNHPIYCFNYWHGAYADYASADEQDVAHPSQTSAVDTYMGHWVSGFSDGTHTLVRASPNGAGANGHETDQWLVHRDFPR